MPDMRFFNTAGPMKPAIHYCIPPLERLDAEAGAEPDPAAEVLRPARAPADRQDLGPCWRCRTS